MANSESSSVGARILIILYALGIVTIGLHPLRAQQGGIWSYLKVESHKLAKKIESLRISEVDLQKEKSLKNSQELHTVVIGKDFSTRASESPSTETSRARLSSNKPTQKQLDNLSGEDRQKLNKLINDL